MRTCHVLEAVYDNLSAIRVSDLRSFGPFVREAGRDYCRRFKGVRSNGTNSPVENDSGTCSGTETMGTRSQSDERLRVAAAVRHVPYVRRYRPLADQRTDGLTVGDSSHLIDPSRQGVEHEGFVDF